MLRVSTCGAAYSAASCTSTEVDILIGPVLLPLTWRERLASPAAAAEHAPPSREYDDEALGNHKHDRIHTEQNHAVAQRRNEENAQNGANHADLTAGGVFFFVSWAVEQ
jgi:hypothetical protein